MNKIIFIHILLFTILIFLKVDFSSVKVLQDEFLITFLLTILGLFLAIITLLYGLIDKIANAFTKVNIDSMKHIHKSLDELKDNTIFILYALIFCLVLSFWAGCDLPMISFSNITIIETNKNLILFDLKVIVLSLVLIGTHDTVKTLFTILNISKKAN